MTSIGEGKGQAREPEETLGPISGRDPMALHQAQVTEVSNTPHNSSAVDVAKHTEQRKGHLSSAGKASKIVRVKTESKP